MSMEEASIVDEEGCLDSGGAEETPAPRDRAETARTARAGAARHGRRFWEIDRKHLVKRV